MRTEEQDRLTIQVREHIDTIGASVDITRETTPLTFLAAQLLRWAVRVEAVKADVPEHPHQHVGTAGCIEADAERAIEQLATAMREHQEAGGC
ncbi:MAG: hypothetical protein R3B90_16115 [Planctomycetaceae bacterium]